MRNGRKGQVLQEHKANGQVITKTIYPLSKKAAERYELIGKARGQDLFHCLYLAGRHAKNFFNRVYGYRTNRYPRTLYPLHVDFYERKRR